MGESAASPPETRLGLSSTPEFFSLPLVLTDDSFPGMGTLRVLTAAEQVGEYLRAELCRGAWGGRMPGGSRLATELGVGRDTVEAALQILERDGLLVPQGAGRRRRIELPEGRVARPMRVAILVTEDSGLDIRWDYRPVVRRVVRWAANVSHGKDDRRQTLTKAEFVEGGTIGPAKGRSGG
jgi:hypothetical protein